MRSDAAPSAEIEHDLEWNERLLTWLDGDLASADGTAFEAHSATCARCQQQLLALARLDESLTAALPPIALDDAFDRRLMARINAMNDDERAAARARAEQELQDNLRSLSRNWRRSAALVIPGVIAGIALAFALTACLSALGVTQAVATETVGALGLGSDVSAVIQMLLTAVVGAAIGLAVANWLASAMD